MGDKMTLINAKGFNSRAELMPRLTRRSLTIALLRSREKLMSRMRPLLASHNITEQQWRVLRAINEEQGVDATDVAQRSCIMAPSLTRILRHLEERGLIARRRDVNDGRRTMLSMTDKGVRLIAEVAPESRRIYGDIRALFGEDRFELLLDLLEELNGLPVEAEQNLLAAESQGPPQG